MNRGHALALLAFVLIVLWRSIYTIHPETGGDAIIKWQLVLQMENSFDASRLATNHHTARWALNLPVWLAVKIFGPSPSVYYLIPLLSFSLLVWILVRLAFRNLNFSFAVAFLTAMLLDPAMLYSSSQFMPSAFGGLYIAISGIFAVNYNKSRKYHALLLSVVFAFLSYAARMPYVFFFPGLLLFLYQKERKAGPPLFWTLMFFILMVLETIVFNALDNRLLFGRFSIILNNHIDSLISYESGLLAYVKSFLKTSWLGILSISISILAACAFWWWKSFRTSLSPIQTIFLYFTVSFLFSYHFLVYEWSPYRTPQPPLAKYAVEVLPFSFFTMFTFLNFLWCQVSSVRIQPAITTLAAVLVTTHSVLFGFPGYTHMRWEPYTKPHFAMWTINEDYRALAEFLRDGGELAITIPKGTGAHWQTIKLVFDTLINSRWPAAPYHYLPLSKSYLIVSRMPPTHKLDRCRILPLHSNERPLLNCPVDLRNLSIRENLPFRF